MLIAFLTTLYASTALAQGISPIPDEDWGTILSVFTVLTALVVLSIATILTPLLRTSRQANNLFLKITYGVASGSGQITEQLTGYLRSLGMNQATFVSQTDFHRGDRLQLNLDSLPNFPERHYFVDAEVTDAKKLRGDKANHLVHVRFQPSRAESDPSLGYYLKILNR